MVKIDIELVFVIVNDFKLDKNYYLDSFKNDFSNYNFEKWFEHENWISYRLSDDDKVLVFKFLGFRLDSLEIYFFEGEKQALFEKKQNIHDYYNWGIVKLIEDKKANYYSVLLIFK